MPEKTLTLEELWQRFDSLARVPGARATIGVRSSEVAAYARVLEYGSIARRPPWPAPGPRTTRAVDLETGAQVVVSTQAPQGFIRVQAPQFAAIVASELGSSTEWLDSVAVQSYVAEVVQRSAGEAVQQLRDAAPRDSGRLAESLDVLSE